MLFQILPNGRSTPHARRGRLPMVPPPVGFSMITDCPSGPLIRSARMRASVSVGPRARVGHDKGDGPRRVGLRPSDVRYGRQRGSARYQMQKISAGKFHGVSSLNAQQGSNLFHLDVYRFNPSSRRLS